LVTFGKATQSTVAVLVVFSQQNCPSKLAFSSSRENKQNYLCPIRPSGKGLTKKEDCASSFCFLLSLYLVVSNNFNLGPI